MSVLLRCSWGKIIKNKIITDALLCFYSGNYSVAGTAPR
ncbi:hypothetical protein B194_3759 [Serratia plymuthica A30]|nr:hypothetical protein B194_3759 [Serratia plymuthica A30]